MIQAAFCPEAHFLPNSDPPDGATDLIRFAATGEWELTFDLSLDDEGSLALVLSQRQGALNAKTGPLPDAADEGLRVWFTWDAPAREARFTAEALHSGKTVATDATSPFPLPINDIARMKSSFDRREIKSPLRYFGAVR